MVDYIWNVMTHAQKPDFVFRRNGRVHLNRQGTSVQSTTDSRGVRIGGSNSSNAGYNMFRGSAKISGYPFHSPVSPLHFPSRASRCAITFQLDSTNLRNTSRVPLRFASWERQWTVMEIWHSLPILVSSVPILIISKTIRYAQRVH
jgi:hypothetical protein